MAINDVVADGLGFNAGQMGFLLTQGFGLFMDLGGSGLSPLRLLRRKGTSVAAIT